MFPHYKALQGAHSVIPDTAISVISTEIHRKCVWTWGWSEGLHYHTATGKWTNKAYKSQRCFWNDPLEEVLKSNAA